MIFQSKFEVSYRGEVDCLIGSNNEVSEIY